MECFYSFTQHILVGACVSWHSRVWINHKQGEVLALMEILVGDIDQKCKYII